MGNEQLVARQMFVETPRRPEGKMTQFAWPVKLSCVIAVPTSASPLKRRD